MHNKLMNKDIPAFGYFIKNCTFEQVNSMQACAEGLRQIGVPFLPKEAFEEALNIGSSNLGI